ncbi:radical SAM protein [Paenibacillus sp. M1]|uniref:Radical SAM protein n=1 Tax=Paenibacillus haidiansis TaxID=1574488 RepID=A0ABU7VQ91_9BACL
MKKGGVCLIYPPLSVHEFPHLALPLLKSYLVSHGVRDVVVKDFNVGMMNQIISLGFDKVEKYFTLNNIKLTASEVEKNFDRARHILKEPREKGKDEWAFRLLNTYIKIAGSGISDFCFSPSSFNEIKERFDLDAVDQESGYVMEDIRNRIIPNICEESPQIVGISIPFASQIYYSLAIGRELKRRLPGIRIVLGGPQVSLFRNLIAGHPTFREAYDALICGQGEKPLLKYVTSVRNGEDLGNVPNLTYYDDKQGRILQTPEASSPDVNELAVPDFSDLPLDQYVYPKLPYFLSRGCYWARCAFCSYRDTNGYGRREIDKIASDLAVMKRDHHNRFFHFIDDAIHPEQTREIAERLIHENLYIKYESYLRLDRRFTAELCELLARSGMRSALFGFESGNERILKLMNKGIHLPQAVQVLKNMKAAGVYSVLSCLIGFPSETEEEAKESLRFLKTNKEWYDQAFLVHYGLISDMFNNKDKYSISSISLDNPVRYDDTGFLALGYEYTTNTGMSVEQALSVIKYGREYLGIQTFEDCFFS